MKKIMAWIILGGVAIMVPLLAKKLGNLPEVYRSSSIFVYNNQLYVLDYKNHIDLYSLKPFRYIKQVSRYGSGPGETPGIPQVIIYPDYLYLYRYGKCMFFSLNGDYLKEFRVPNPNLILFAPIGKNFIVEKSIMAAKSHDLDLSICSYKEKEGIKHKKVVYVLNVPDLRTINKKVELMAFSDYWRYIIFDNKVFLADSTRGIFAEIYDSEGNRINQIRLNNEKLIIPEERKEALKKEYDSNPENKAYENIYFLGFPEYYPAFHNFFVGKDKLYFVTYKTQGNKREIIVTDWKGKLLKKAYVPVIYPGERFAGAIANDKLYYIFDNEESEEWELHVEDIK